MKQEDAIKMIELCITLVTNQNELTRMIDLIIERKVDLFTPKKRAYTKKENSNAE